MEKITKELPAVKKEFYITLEAMSEGILEITSKGKIVFANYAGIYMFNKP